MAMVSVEPGRPHRSVNLWELGGSMTDHATRLHQSKMGTARRIVAQLRGAPPDWAPNPMINAATVYTDPARHALERRKIFRETPLVACLSSDLPEPGSYRTFDEAGVPVVIVRGKGGELKGFLNVCRHRGARLVRDAQGKASRFSCWFHAWTFSSDGALVGVPQREGFEACAKERNLVPVPVAERHGLVFVKCSPNSTMDIDAFLGDFAPELAMLELGKAQFVKSELLPVAANWKYALDTYGEGYHFASLHRQTLAPYRHAEVQVYDRWGPHHRITWAAHAMSEWMKQPEQEWDADTLIGWVHFIFPNTILYTGSVKPGKGYYTTFRHFPGEAVGETITYKSIYAPFGAPSAEQRADIEAAFAATAHVVRTEDYIVAAEGWRSLASVHEDGATVIYGRQEVALQHQHRAIAAILDCAPPREVVDGMAAE
ncbi:MAG: aromatic ring-hydroxylating dioxygenase subunit alpha [Rhodospirillaceae bacterium]|nr:MAG: aromatic ring-hydroxylating dioxygenase subunit alpha [Rhodospirillaceae bacterium]